MQRTQDSPIAVSLAATLALAALIGFVTLTPIQNPGVPGTDKTPPSRLRGAGTSPVAHAPALGALGRTRRNRLRRRHRNHSALCWAERGSARPHGGRSGRRHRRRRGRRASVASRPPAVSAGPHHPHCARSGMASYAIFRCGLANCRATRTRRSMNGSAPSTTRARCLDRTGPLKI